MEILYKSHNEDSSKGNILRKNDDVGSMNYSNSGSIQLESTTTSKDWSESILVYSIESLNH